MIPFAQASRSEFSPQTDSGQREPVPETYPLANPKTTCEYRHTNNKFKTLEKFKF